jgi:hypothetical protein
MNCSVTGCRRYDALDFPNPDDPDRDRSLCGRHRTDEQHQLVLDLAERGKRVGITGGGDFWPYGQNITVGSRARLVDWAEANGYRLADPRHPCFHWVVGQAHRCSALRDYHHPGRIIDDNHWTLDHLTFWTRGGAPALMLAQPYSSDTRASTRDAAASTTVRASSYRRRR